GGESLVRGLALCAGVYRRLVPVNGRCRRRAGRGLWPGLWLDLHLLQGLRLNLRLRLLRIRRPDRAAQGEAKGGGKDRNACHGPPQSLNAKFIIPQLAAKKERPPPAGV